MEEIIAREREALALIEEAEKKAEEILSEARRRAEAILAKASTKEKIDEILKREEEKVEKEGEGILKEYESRVEELRRIPKDRFDKAVNLVLKEVLRFERRS